MFNESFATAVERLGGARWLQQHGSAAARVAVRRARHAAQDFRALTQAYRRKLEALYCQRPRRCRQARRARRRADGRSCGPTTRALKAERWGGFAGYDAWFAARQQCLVRRAGRLRRTGAATSSACSSARAATSRASMPRCGAWPPCRRPSATPLARHWRYSSDAQVATEETAVPDIHIHRDQPGPGEGAQAGLEVGRRGREEVRHGVHRVRRRDQRHGASSSAPASTAQLTRRGRPLRAGREAGLPARRVQQHDRERDREEPRRAAGRKQPPAPKKVPAAPEGSARRQGQRPPAKPAAKNAARR